ncbi:LysM peptidoglycan-binding domain-containing protein [Sanguibacter sp. 25GB23B1]|uniref:lytic transglycosylase n=1 Tax=unclassified Sanguibacter TaxID=2645534 RepID=UPI0032B00190
MPAPRSTAAVSAAPVRAAVADNLSPSRSLSRTLGRYAVRYGTTGLALAAASIAASASSASADETYEVEKGDTVSHIAQRTGTPATSIRAANGLDEQYRIREGQRLVIPSAGVVPVLSPAGAPAPALPVGGAAHRVSAGDTVSSLAVRFAVTEASIVAANGLDSRATIRIGQTLSIPAGAAPAGAAPTPPAQQLVGDTFAGRTYASDVVSAANSNKAALLSISVPSKDEMRQIVRDTAVAHGVDPRLAQAVALQESGFDQRAVSPANAIGTMQVIPTSGEWASGLVGRDLNLLDPRDNVTAGVAILARLIETSPSLDTAIAGYYQGQTSVRKYGMFDDTRRYVANVQTLATQQP